MYIIAKYDNENGEMMSTSVISYNINFKKAMSSRILRTPEAESDSHSVSDIDNVNTNGYVYVLAEWDETNHPTSFISLSAITKPKLEDSQYNVGNEMMGVLGRFVHIS